MLRFFPGDALPGLHCSCPQFLLVVGVLCLLFWLQQVKWSMRHHPLSFEAFAWLWADNIALTATKYLLLLSAITYQYKKEYKFLWYTCPHHYTTSTMLHRLMVTFWKFFFFLWTLLLPSFWYKLIFVKWVHRMLFQTHTLFKCLICSSCLWGCGNHCRWSLLLIVNTDEVWLNRQDWRKNGPRASRPWQPPLISGVI